MCILGDLGSADLTGKVVLAPFPRFRLLGMGSSTSTDFMLLVLGGGVPLLCSVWLGIVAPVAWVVDVLGAWVLGVLVGSGCC